jgi:20S proteasome alpha/beta subunit
MLDDLKTIGNDKSKWSLSSSYDIFESSNYCFVNLTIAEAKRFVKSAFQSAAEREITIGNGISYKILRKVHGNYCVESYHEHLQSHL